MFCVFIVRFLNFFFCYMFSFLFFLQMHSVLKDVWSYCSVCILTDDGTHLHTLNCKSVPPHRRMEMDDFGEPGHCFTLKSIIFHCMCFHLSQGYMPESGDVANNIQFVYGNLLLKYQILSHASHFYL